MKNRGQFNQFTQTKMCQKVNSLKNKRYFTRVNLDKSRTKINSMNKYLYFNRFRQEKTRQLVHSIKSNANQTKSTQHGKKQSKYKIFFNRLKQRKILKQIGLDVGTALILLSLLFMGLKAYEKISHDNAQRDALDVAMKVVGGDNSINTTDPIISANETEPDQTTQKVKNASTTTVIGTLSIPKLKRTLPIVEGTSEKELRLGVGHMTETVLPGKGDQIILSGHNDTVFRNFDKMKIGDRFIVNLSNGKYTYEIRKTIIVDKDDTSVVRKMGEEVLVVTTCYPFVGPSPAPQRFVAYAYPVAK